MHLPPCPQTGGGVHYWILGAARRLSFQISDPDKIASMLREQVQDCGRFVPEREIAEAVGKVLGSPLKMRSSFLDPRFYSAERILDRDRIDEIAAGGLNLEELTAMSPDPVDIGAEGYIDALWGDDELICAATGHPGTAETRHRSDWRGMLEHTSHIVPSPMSSIAGTNLQGKTSPRCLDNTGPRRFLVIEGDSTTRDEQAAVLLHLNKIKPLALVVDSAGKSLHGWFPTWDETEEKVERFHNYACSIGGDPATLTRCQLVRTPGGLRRGATGQLDARQEVKFFNQEACTSWR